MSSDLPADQTDSPDEEQVRGLSPADVSAGSSPAPESTSSSDDLTAEEWAELERATDPSGQADSAAPQQADDDDAVAKVPPREEEDDEFVQDGELSPDQDLAGDEDLSVRENGGSAAEAVATHDDEQEGQEPATEPADPVPKDASEDPASEDPASEDPASEDPASEDRATDGEPGADQASEDHGSTTVSMPLPRVIAVANQKGGVGKTTTTVNIAACLAEQGYRTLLVDLDPQANASTGLGLEPRELEHSVYHVMLHGEDADSCIEPTEVKNLFVLPSSLDLAGAEIELVAVMSREHRLRLAIESVLDDYDYVLIDCPPSLGLLTINALTAAREVLVPIQCEYYALEGLGQLMRNVDLVKANLNPGLQISHIVLVMFDPRTKLAGQVVDEVRGHFGSTVCANVIPRTVRLSEAPSFGQPITTFDTASRGAAAYRAVTQEVLGGQA